MLFRSEKYVYATKIFTVMWGLVAIAFASFGTLFENLIQFVNIIGSVFYGTILGIFLVAFYFKRIRGNAIFFAAIISEIIIIAIFYADVVGYLWLNVIGCINTILLSIIFQSLMKSKDLQPSKAS